MPKRQKGILPVPREIFPPRQPTKPTHEYISNATRDKKPENMVPMDQMSELQKYRARMSETRKEHLRQGLVELYQRKQSMTASVARRSEQKKEERARLISQDERIDAQLTNASVPQAMQPVKGAIAASANRRSKKKFEALQARKEEARRDATHTLYMNARTFITTEQQLDAEILKAFPDGAHEEWRTAATYGTSIWNLDSPPTIADKLQASSRRAKKDFSTAGLTDSAEKYRLDQERMKRIAEELSGGKI